MVLTTTSIVECPQCEQWYDPSKTKQLVRYTCPNCGYETTEFKHVRVNANVAVSATVSDLETKSERVEVKKGFDLLVLALTIGVPIESSVKA